MALFTVTVDNRSPALDRRDQECAVIARALDLAANDLRRSGGAKTSGSIIDGGGVSVGSWLYSPQATS